jgi:hypothetical protein
MTPILRWEAPPHATGGAEIADRDGVRYYVKRVQKGARIWKATASRAGRAPEILGASFSSKDAAKAACETVAGPAS